MKEKFGYKIIRKCCKQWEEAHRESDKGAWWWMQREVPFCPFCGNKIIEKQVAIEFKADDGDDYDDHTSVWGGAGPDCTTERREAA
jgi:hypothetical protein